MEKTTMDKSMNAKSLEKDTTRTLEKNTTQSLEKDTIESSENENIWDHEANFYDFMVVDENAKKNSLNHNSLFGDLDYMYMKHRHEEQPKEEKKEIITTTIPQKKKKKKKKKKTIDKNKLYQDMGSMDEYDEYNF